VEAGPDHEEIAANLEIVCGIAGVATDARSLLMPRAAMRELFYAADVPEAVIAVDEASVSRVPARAAAEVLSSAHVAGFARRVTVPILLGFGAELDLSSDPSAEPAVYAGSDDITLYLVEGARHCHNFATQRIELWDQIAAWSARLRPPVNVSEPDPRIWQWADRNRLE
jgi:hypothetical protein